MQTSTFIAKLMGPVFLAVGIALFVNQAVYRNVAEEFLRSRALIHLSGLLTMTGGLAVVLTHNAWAADWRVVITVLGWLAVIGGALRTTFPQWTETVSRRMLERPVALTAHGAIWFALGLILCFFGYAAQPSHGSTQ